MTQSTEPSQITLSAMRDLFAQKFPNLVRPFEQIKADLEQGTGAQALANLIGCEVEGQDDQGLSVYRWCVFQCNLTTEGSSAASVQ